MIKYSLHINKEIWHVSFYLHDTNGKRKQKCLSTSVRAINKNTGKYISGSKKKADIKAQEIVSQFDDTVYSAEYSEMNLADYVADWIERDKSRISVTTYDKYRSMLNKHIRPYFTELGLNIKQIKPIHLEKYVSFKLSEGVSANTIQKHIGIIRPALNDALKNGYIKINPAVLMDKPKVKKPTHKSIPAEKLNQYIQAFKGTEIEIPVLLTALFGLRRSEVLGLTWSAVDFENRTLEIRKTVVTGKRNGKTVSIIRDEMKTEASQGTYYLNDTVLNFLRKLKAEQDNYIRETKEYTDFICVNKVGQLIKPDYVTSKFEKVLKAKGLEHIRFHDLRHSAISILANDSQFTMKQVQAYARHSQMATTADIYSHVDESVKLIELNRITSYLQDSLAV